MVNHYASLLLNLPGENTPGGVRSYLVNKDYLPVNLPVNLKQFYSILFPDGVSDYQKQFLCFAYLRILESTGLTDLVYSMDPRVTYDLDKLTEYFRISQISTPTATDGNFNLSVSGTFTPSIKNNYYYNSFTVTQQGYDSSLVVRSDIDKVYLNGNITRDNVSTDVTIPINYSSSGGMTDSIAVGGTGLSFVITGPIQLFTQTANKSWNFIAEAPFIFNFPAIFKTLQTRQNTIDYMLKYSQPSPDMTNENIWNNHFNDLYKFAGLLNCYVARVNSLI
jgi:hypothetical protein